MGANTEIQKQSEIENLLDQLESCLNTVENNRYRTKKILVRLRGPVLEEKEEAGKDPSACILDRLAYLKNRLREAGNDTCEELTAIEQII